MILPVWWSVLNANYVILTGPVLERDYRRTARKHNITIDVRGGDNMANFPIEKARFRSIWYVITAASVSMIGYGWALYFKVVCSSLRSLGQRQLMY